MFSAAVGKASATVTTAVPVDTAPPVSVTVTVTVCVPGTRYVCVAMGWACGPLSVPSPKSKLYVAIGVESVSHDPDASAVTARGAVPDAGVTASDTVGPSPPTATVSVTVTLTVYVPALVYV